LIVYFDLRLVLYPPIFYIDSHLSLDVCVFVCIHLLDGLPANLNEQC